MGILSSLEISFYPEILVHWEMCKLDGADARDHVFNRPLTSEDIKEFKARGTYMDAVCNGIRDNKTIQVDKEFRVKEIGMVCRMVGKDFIKIKKFIWSLSFKPSLVKILFKGTNLVPLVRFPLLIFL